MLPAVTSWKTEWKNYLSYVIIERLMVCLQRIINLGALYGLFHAAPVSAVPLFFLHPLKD